MEKLQIRNIRSLTDTGLIRIAPITVLVGQNSSGKSTFARLLPLLKQSAEARAREPFLWLGRLVDFGSAQEARSRFSANKELGITVEQKVPSWFLDARRRVWTPSSYSQSEFEPVKLSIDYCFTEKESAAPTYRYTFEYRQQSIKVSIDQIGTITKLQVNESDFSNSTLRWMSVSNWSGPFPIFELNEEASAAGRHPSLDLHKFVRGNLDARTGPERAAALVRVLTTGSILTLYDRALTASPGDEFWRRKVRSWGQNSPQLVQLRNLIVAQQFFGEVGSSVVAMVRRGLSNVKYVTPLRASAERYYRLQGLSVEEIDPQGQNIAMFIHNLASSDRTKFSTWMNRFFGVSVETQPSQGHVSLFLRSHSGGGGGYNLADTGFGYSQMLPILVQLWMAGSRKPSQLQQTSGPMVFAIEQPELHLHPKLQAKLADVFLAAVEAARDIGVELRLIVETHSEQIVSALGLRIARNAASAQDVNIVLFEKTDMETPTVVSETMFEPDGGLNNWPYGFFEADN